MVTRNISESKRVPNSNQDGRPTRPSAQPLSRTTKLSTLRRMRLRAGCALGPHPRPRLRLSQRPASSHVFTQIRVGMRIVRRIARVKRNCPQSDQTGDSCLLTLHKCTPLSMHTALFGVGMRLHMCRKCHAGYVEAHKWDHPSFGNAVPLNQLLRRTLSPRRRVSQGLSQNLPLRQKSRMRPDLIVGRRWRALQFGADWGSAENAAHARSGDTANIA